MHNKVTKTELGQSKNQIRDVPAGMAPVDSAAAVDSSLMDWLGAGSSPVRRRAKDPKTRLWGLPADEER